MYKDFNIRKDLIKLSEEAEIELKDIFKEIDDNTMLCSSKVLKAFQDEAVNTSDFSEVSGYGYSDTGRDKLERVFARVFKAEDALVRPQIMSGTHAITLCLSGLLKYGDTFISISGEPYDSLRTVIGIDGDISKQIGFNLACDTNRELVYKYVYTLKDRLGSFEFFLPEL